MADDATDPSLVATYIVLEDAGDGAVSVHELDAGADLIRSGVVGAGVRAAALARLERDRPRWVWAATSTWYPRLLADDLRVTRAHDLRLCRAILRRAVATAGTELARSPLDDWDVAAPVSNASATTSTAATLFDVFAPDPADGRSPGGADGSAGADARNDSSGSAAVTELRRQLAAVSASTSAGRIRLLLAAESAGALVAAEIAATGLPWSAHEHDAMLTEALGPRPRFGGRPVKLEELAERIRTELAAPQLNPDSPVELIKALRRAGLAVESTRSWELERLDHPVIGPLLEYKKLARLLSANGWAWLDEWVAEDRFRPEYVVGGVVTGRWATSGGGALQLPKQIRRAARADPGWKLVVADAAQLEPRILTAMSGDLAMAAAGRGTDLYAGIVERGVVPDRAHAKLAMLGAMYGATSGESGRLMPRLTRAYPQAIALVEQAARAGEAGEVVSTWLGRSSPRPTREWFEEQSIAFSSDGDAEAQRRAAARARDWGRFTRNFIVQGTAAEWALCWLGEIRHRLRTRFPELSLPASPHLVYFLHDEVIVHAPEDAAVVVATIIEESAHAAGRSLFGDFPGDFPVTVAVVDSYDQAK